MSRLLAAVALTCPLFSVARAEEDDWTQFRGANRDAVWGEKDLLESFPQEGLKVRWRIPVGGGFSSPVIAQGRVYLADSEMQKPQAWEHLRCLDEKTGALLWTHTTEVVYDESWFRDEQKDGPRATPIVRDDRVFAIGANSDLFCLDALQGTVIWKKALRDEYDLKDHRCITPSPLIEGNLLILVIGGQPDAGVVALDKNTGKEAWRALNNR